MVANRRLVFTVLLVLATPSGSVSRAAGAPQKQTEPKAQQNLIKEVRHQLVLLPYYSVFDNLVFQLQGSKVILIGQVLRPTLKPDAKAAVKGSPAVTSVENNIEVLPTSPMDDQTRRGCLSRDLW
jgi:hyperosmotically inducible protein